MEGQRRRSTSSMQDERARTAPDGSGTGIAPVNPLRSPLSMERSPSMPEKMGLGSGLVTSVVDSNANRMELVFSKFKMTAAVYNLIRITTLDHHAAIT